MRACDVTPDFGRERSTRLVGVIFFRALLAFFWGWPPSQAPFPAQAAVVNGYHILPLPGYYEKTGRSPPGRRRRPTQLLPAGRCSRK